MVALDCPKVKDDFEYVATTDDSICRSGIFRGDFQGEQCYGDICYEVYEALCYDKYGNLARVGSFSRRK